MPCAAPVNHRHIATAVDHGQHHDPSGIISRPLYIRGIVPLRRSISNQYLFVQMHYCECSKLQRLRRAIIEKTKIHGCAPCSFSVNVQQNGYGETVISSAELTARTPESCRVHLQSNRVSCSDRDRPVRLRHLERFLPSSCSHDYTTPSWPVAQKRAVRTHPVIWHQRNKHLISFRCCALGTEG